MPRNDCPRGVEGAVDVAEGTDARYFWAADAVGTSRSALSQMKSLLL